MYNEVSIRQALFRTRPRLFFAPDFNGLVPNPFGTTVAVLHDLTALKLDNSSPKSSRDMSTRLSDWRWRAYYRKLQRANHIVAISENAKQDAVRLLDIPSSRFTVIHHGVDHLRFYPCVGQGIFAEQPPYFLNLGGRNENKNQERLLEAFANAGTINPETQLFFAGPWREHDHEWLRIRARELGLTERVSHIGYVADSDLPSLYGNALAFVFPSLEEGFGLPVLEAMASGAPVITSNRSSLPEVAGDAALLIDPYDIADLALAMGRIALEPELRRDLSIRGIARAQGFTWEETAKRTALVLSQAAPPNERL